MQQSTNLELQKSIANIVPFTDFGGQGANSARIRVNPNHRTAYSRPFLSSCYTLNTIVESELARFYLPSTRLAGLLPANRCQFRHI